MRLGDFDALKETLFIKFGNQLPNGLLDEIDNAPTVKTYCYFCGQTEHGKIEERPTGEWIDYSDEGYVECPFCGNATNCEDNKDELHYCWHCGARMKGGAE